MQETDMLSLRIEMQGKALDGFHRRALQRNEGIDERLADLERRMPGRCYQEEAEAPTNVFPGGDREVNPAMEAVSTTEREKQEQLGRLLASVAALMTRVGDIEMGVARMRASLGTMAETFEGHEWSGDGVKAVEGIEAHAGGTHSLETRRKYEIPLCKRKSGETLEDESPTKRTRRPSWKKREGGARCVG